MKLSEIISIDSTGLSELLENMSRNALYRMCIMIRLSL